MTDQEKIAKIVEWMGGWPEHQAIFVPSNSTLSGVGPFCERGCGFINSFTCKNFNPFTRIEDAFLVVERLDDFDFELVNCLTPQRTHRWNCWIGDETSKGSAEGHEPARAIAEAAWQVIERLNV